MTFGGSWADATAKRPNKAEMKKALIAFLIVHFLLRVGHHFETHG